MFKNSSRADYPPRKLVGKSIAVDGRPVVACFFMSSFFGNKAVLGRFSNFLN